MDDPPAATVSTLLERAAGRLAVAGSEAPKQESLWLLSHVWGVSAAQVRLRAGERLPRRLAEEFERLLSRRESGEPLQYVLGSWPFLELELACDPRGLIPRPETEDLVSLARTMLPSDRPGIVADVGTGGGCIALALCASHPSLHVIAIDTSVDALGLARENRDRLFAGAGPALVAGDLLSAVVPAGALEMVVANLPYVREDEWEALQPEVRRFEPREALVAANAGLELIGRLCEQAPRRLRAGGGLLLEMSPEQTETMRQQLVVEGWRQVEVLEDRYRRPRFLRAISPARPGDGPDARPADSAGGAARRGAAPGPGSVA